MRLRVYRRPLVRRTIAGSWCSWPACAASAWAEDWPAWRGPRGNSTSLETDLPVEWSADSGVVWKTLLPEWGTSTPVIWGDAVFVTTQRDEDLLVLRLNRRTGAIEWTQKVGQAATPRGGKGRQKQKFHVLHNLASASPATDGKSLVVHFGNGDLATYDFDGKLLARTTCKTNTARTRSGGDTPIARCCFATW